MSEQSRARKGAVEASREAQNLLSRQLARIYHQG